eukprot:15290-Eustigmatos_ZCMA.PRE.1
MERSYRHKRSHTGGTLGWLFRCGHENCLLPIVNRLRCLRVASNDQMTCVCKQLVDDVLDFEQSSETLGKPAMSDIKQGLATAPVLIAAQ